MCYALRNLGWFVLYVITWHLGLAFLLLGIAMFKCALSWLTTYSIDWRSMISLMLTGSFFTFVGIIACVGLIMRFFRKL